MELVGQLFSPAIIEIFGDTIHPKSVPVLMYVGKS